ncbi:MAG: SCO family protein [Solirubrobacteraceae bacterium]|nr:SCO family protein [Patulibacter sp.]
MASRLRLTIIGFGTAFLLGITIWLVAGAPGAQGTQENISNGFAGAIRPEIPAQPLTGLHDENGTPIKLKKDVTILTFLYTQCKDTCPTTAQQIRATLDKLQDPPQAIAISVDPLGDTESSARTFLASQTLLGRMHFALGPPVALQRQWNIYGIQPQSNDTDHTASVVLLDKEGRQRIGFPLDKLTPEGLAHDVQALRNEPTA